LKTRITGFPKGNNTGVAIAKGEYICILNPDTVVAEDTLQKYWLSPKGKRPRNRGVKLIDGAGGFLPESKEEFLRLCCFYKMTGLYKLFPRVKVLGNTMRNS
jgi:hypothetical protein